MKGDSSGPAFPGETIEGGYYTPIKVRHPGMSLRDWFASQALEGMLEHSRNGHGYRPTNPSQPWHEAISEEAYALADAMIAAREKE